MDSSLILGPMLRFVDETTASVWVETRAAARVRVSSAGREWEAATFSVHGHHYALVEVKGLEPGSSSPYTVEIDGLNRTGFDGGIHYPEDDFHGSTAEVPDRVT
ncbi:DUF7800 domain-containing protein [Arthrobacter subterraneus]|uniref:DUF7800 domain-containing protein n=1 Tax=Arthrobacter subterraneus TaxID=335973 RepID=UPI00382587AB